MSRGGSCWEVEQEEDHLLPYIFRRFSLPQLSNFLYVLEVSLAEAVTREQEAAASDSQRSRRFVGGRMKRGRGVGERGQYPAPRHQAYKGVGFRVDPSHPLGNQPDAFFKRVLWPRRPPPRRRRERARVLPVQ